LVLAFGWLLLFIYVRLFGWTCVVAFRFNCPFVTHCRFTFTHTHVARLPVPVSFGSVGSFTFWFCVPFTGTVWPFGFVRLVWFCVLGLTVVAVPVWLVGCAVTVCWFLVLVYVCYVPVGYVCCGLLVCVWLRSLVGLRSLWFVTFTRCWLRFVRLVTLVCPGYHVRLLFTFVVRFCGWLVRFVGYVWLIRWITLLVLLRFTVSLRVLRFPLVCWFVGYVRWLIPFWLVLFGLVRCCCCWFVGSTRSRFVHVRFAVCSFTVYVLLLVVPRFVGSVVGSFVRSVRLLRLVVVYGTLRLFTFGSVG